MSILAAGCGAPVDSLSSGPGGTGDPTAYVELFWDPPDYNTDDSPTEGQLAGYNIYYGTESGVYTNLVTIDRPDINSCSIGNLTEGEWYFVITALNIYGSESAPSPQVSRTVSASI